MLGSYWGQSTAHSWTCFVCTGDLGLLVDHDLGTTSLVLPLQYVHRAAYPISNSFKQLFIYCTRESIFSHLLFRLALSRSLNISPIEMRASANRELTHKFQCMLFFSDSMSWNCLAHCIETLSEWARDDESPASIYHSSLCNGVASHVKTEKQLGTLHESTS